MTRRICPLCTKHGAPCELCSTDLDGYGSRVGHLIRAARTRRKMTQLALAEALGISRTDVVRIEKGSHCPSVRTVVDVAVALNVRPSSLLADLDAVARRPV